MFRPPSRPTPPPTSQAPPLAGDPRDSELSLRRELSRLELQLAEAQRALVAKDDQLAAELERQLLAAAEVTSTRGELRQATERVIELTESLDATRARHATELATLEERQRVALETASAAHAGDVQRIEVDHDEEIRQLRANHAQAIVAVRAEVELVASERDRMATQLASARAESTRALADCEAQYKREVVQLSVAHGEELAVQARRMAAEVARVAGERDAAVAATAETARAAKQRETLWENTMSELRETCKELEAELDEIRATCSRVETEKSASEDKLASTASELVAALEDARVLRQRVDDAEAQLKRHASDRERHIAHLEEALAKLRTPPR